jgi:hypothetical protein
MQYTRYIQRNKTTTLIFITRMGYGENEGGSNDTVGNK